MRSLLRLVAFELDRAFHGFRLAPWLGLVILSSQQACSLTAHISSSLKVPWEDLSVIDSFYLGLNDTGISAMLIPSACCVLCADMFSKDLAHDYLRLVMSRVDHPRAVWIAKIVATFIICLFTNTAFFALTVFFSALANMGLPAATAAPWLQSPGVDFTTFGAFCPVPASWHYPLLILLTVPTHSFVIFPLLFLLQIAFSKSPAPHAPIPLSIGLLIFANSLPYVANSFGLLFDAPDLLAPTGWISDRLCLSSYRLDAGFFQTSAGELAAGRDVAASDPGSLRFPINSWASLLAMCTGCWAISLYLVMRLSRKEGVVLSRQR